MESRCDASAVVKLSEYTVSKNVRDAYKGFCLNMTPLVMKFIIEVVWSQERSVGRVMLAYFDVYVKESIMSTEQVWVKLAEYRPMCKELEHLKDGACMLRLLVIQEHNTVMNTWKCDP